MRKQWKALLAVCAGFFLLIGCSELGLPDPDAVLATSQAEVAGQARTEAAGYLRTREAQVVSAVPGFLKTLVAGARTDVPGAFATLAAGGKTEAPSVFATLIAGGQTPTPASPFGTLAAGQQQPSAPFVPPAQGYIGMKFRELYPGSGLPHAGIDIWPSREALNGGQPGQPVVAVYDGWAGPTGSGLEICHPKLDKALYPDLPHYEVCTYYGHLTGIPEKFLDPKIRGCSNLVEVKQGEFLGNAALDPQSNIVHLHFSVVRQTQGYFCWTDERSDANRLDPMLYLGLSAAEYAYLDVFP